MKGTKKPIEKNFVGNLLDNNLIFTGCVILAILLQAFMIWTMSKG